MVAERLYERLAAFSRNVLSKTHGLRRSAWRLLRFAPGLLGCERAGDQKGTSRLAFVSAIGAVIRRKGALMRLLAAPVLLSLGFTPNSTESAVANGDTDRKSVV